MFVNLLQEVKHYHNEKTSKALNDGGWEELRKSGNENYKVCSYQRRLLPYEIGKFFAQLLHESNIQAVHSYGCGTGANEIEIILQSKQANINKYLEISASDNDTYSITKLKQIHPEINWQVQNLSDGLNEPVSLGIRVDTELNTQQWREVFKKSQAKRILFLCHCYTAKNLFNSAISNAFKSKKQFAGYIRTEIGIEQLFEGSRYILFKKTHVKDNLYLFDLVKK